MALPIPLERYRDFLRYGTTPVHYSSERGRPVPSAQMIRDLVDEVKRLRATVQMHEILNASAVSAVDKLRRERGDQLVWRGPARGRLSMA